MRTSKTVLGRVLFLVILIPLSYPAMAQLKADFTSSTQSGCSPLVVSFTNASNGSPSTYKWYLGNGVVSTDENPTSSYFDAGVYTVKLVIYKGSESDSIVKTGYVTVYKNPAVAFNVSDTAGCFPLNVVYTDKSNPGSGDIVSRAWDFGDGNVSSQPQPSHSYLSSGIFSVTLTVTNTYGCTSTLQRNNLIKINHGVHADYTVNAGNICHSPAGFSFTSTSTGDDPLTYKWSFGDGATATQAQASHNYINAGAYTVSLKVSSGAGCTDSITKPLSVAFVKSAISSMDTFCINNQVQFINSSVPAPSASVWSFGDNTTSSSISPFKTYSSAGQYTVKAVNTFSTGCIDSITKKVFVVNAVVPSFKTSDTAGCSLPYTAHFTNTTVGGGVTYVWDFGDGRTSTDINPVHVYSSYGNYTITLKALNGGGCEESVVKSSFITVQPVKIIGVAGLTPGCVPHSVQPSVQTNAGYTITKYSWDFGDGFISTQASPTHTYTKEGVYIVKVKIETDGGCSDSLTLSDSVGHKLHPGFTIDPSNVCASQSVNFNNTTQGPYSNIWWYPGDGTVIFKAANLVYKYRDTGYFNVMLVVEDRGCFDTITKNKAVHIAPPVAKFKVDHECINKMRITITDRSIDDRTHRWDFGDGSSDTAKNPVHIYKATGQYTLKLSVSNGACTSEADSTVNIVNEKGVLRITDSVICRNAKLNYLVSNVNPRNILTTSWFFVGSNVINVYGSAIAYTYTVNGNFSPSVVTTDILGCKDTLNANHSVTVYGPTARFKVLDPRDCQNSIVHFTDTSATDGIHPIRSWAFDFGDGNTGSYASKTVFSNKYKDTGLFTVSLTVTDSYGCSDVSKQPNSVFVTRPYASIKLSDSIVCPGTKVTFTSSSVGYNLHYSWDLGDGTIVGDASPTTHLYAAQGIYSPKLFVTDINNCKDSITLAGGVRVFTPSAKFALSDSFSACPPLAVVFSNKSENFATFQWNFGDGNTSDVVSPTHTYTYPGVYKAQIVLKGNGACADSISRNITIKGPTGTLQYSTAPVCYPSSQKLKAVAQNAVQYLWDYSDGQTKLADQDTTSHIYAPGFYLPKLILIDQDGCKVAIKGNDTLKIFDIKAKASAGSEFVCDSGKIIFNDSSITNDVIVSHKWYFNNSVISTAEQLTHYFNAPGVFKIKLVDVTATGCTDSVMLTAPVSVVQSPVVNITGKSSYCMPANISLQGTDARPDSAAITWNWDFGNGVTSNVQNPSGIILPEAGNYTVTASATNSNGCVGKASIVIDVNGLPAVKAGLDTTICQAARIRLQASGAIDYTWTTPGTSCTDCYNPVVKPDSTAVYSVTGTDEHGCSASSSVTVKVSLPVHIAITNADTLCNGQAKQLMATGAQTYQWYPPTYLSDAAVAQPTFQSVKDTTITYQVVGRDEKKCFTDTAFVKVKVYPIPEMKVVQSAITVSAGGQATLSTISSPDVTKWKWSPAMWLDNANAASPVAQPRESITYTVVAANDGACITRAQIAVTVICNGGNIFVPNTFSPNGDGVNERFYPQGRGLYNIKSFRVFNRWGQIVFEKMNGGANNAADGWDGTFKGQKLAADVYVYIIEVMCNNNTVIPVKGNVTLLR